MNNLFFTSLVVFYFITLFSYSCDAHDLNDVIMESADESESQRDLRRLMRDISR